MSTLLLISAFVALNIIFILVKFKQNRGKEAALDIALLIGIAILFSGSFNALVVGTFASFIVSLYLYFSPPSFVSRSR